MKTVAALGMVRKDIKEVNQQTLRLEVKRNPESRIFNLEDSMDDDTSKQG